MAKDTNIQLRNQIIYSVYVRNHGENGTFADVEQDLDRIASLGTDIIWFMPIHPIGEAEKKGDLGCPYAIRDYRAINPEYGTLEDFSRLTQAIHARGMKCMIDVVYNHTSPDSVLVQTHPEYFLQTADGKLTGKVPEWSDVVDFDYENKALWTELIDTLVYWVKQGVDGFRCDVASLVPLEFWLEARREVAKVNPDVIWLSESIEPHFITELAERGFKAHTDVEVFEAFDMLYDYDVWVPFKRYLTGEAKLETYVNALRDQHKSMPDNYVKLRNLENHDNLRARKRFNTQAELKMWMAFQFCQMGSAMIYAGQEAQDANTPSLFDRDPVDWSGLSEGFTSYIKQLTALKKKPILTYGTYEIVPCDLPVIQLKYTYEGAHLYGVFNVEGRKGTVEIDLPDGLYTDYLSGEKVQVMDGHVSLETVPRILTQ